MNRFRDVVAGYAAELRAQQVSQADALAITPERRDSLFARLEEADVHLDREHLRSRRDYIEEQLGNELTRAFFGSESVLRRKAKNDRQLQAALQVLRGAPTQDDVLTAAMQAQLSGRVR